MPNLMTHLKKVSEQKPQATYYNVDMLKYQVRLLPTPNSAKNVCLACRREGRCTLVQHEGSRRWGRAVLGSPPCVDRF